MATQGTWVVISEMGPTQQIAETSTTKNHEILKRVHARDTSSQAYGEGEFIYLKGVASTAAGDLVMYDLDGTTTRTVARTKGPCAVAMSANLAGSFGWYMVQGVTPCTSLTVAANTTAYLTATAGTIDDAVVAGDIVYGARIASADSGGSCKLLVQYPHVQDTDNA